MKFGKLVGIVGFVGVLWLLWQVRQVLLLLFAAITFATVINALVRQLQKLSLPRGIAVTAAVSIVLTTLLTAAWFIVPRVANQLPEYAMLAEGGLEQLQLWYGQIRGIVPGEPLGGTKLDDLLPQIAQLSPRLVGRLVTFFTGSLDFLLNFLLVVVATIMLLANPASYRKVALSAFPKFYRHRADDILSECERSLTGWFVGTLFNVVVIALCSGIGLAILGVPLPMVNAVLAGLLAFIPNIGPILSVIPPALMGLTIKPWIALAVIALYVLIQQIESNILTPLVMKQQVSLLPAVTLFSQVIATIFFGFLGLFLALPIVVVLQIWLKELLVKDVLDRWPAPRRSHRRAYPASRKPLGAYSK